jgi:hypothetical protein
MAALQGQSAGTRLRTGRPTWRANARVLAISASLPTAGGRPRRVWYIFDSGASFRAGRRVHCVDSGCALREPRLFRTDLGRTGGAPRGGRRSGLRSGAHLRGDCVDHAPVASPARRALHPAPRPKCSWQPNAAFIPDRA